MADIATIRSALAAQLTQHTGLRALAEPRDSVAPPVAVILAGQPFVTYGQTMDGTFQVNLRVLVLMTEGAPTERVQRALDAYMGIGSGEPASVAGAIQADPTLGGAVHFCVPVAAMPPARIDYNGVTYFGSRIDVQVGTM